MDTLIDQANREKETISIVNPSKEASSEEYEEVLVTLDNGSQYSGRVVNGKPNGQGIEYCVDGCLYTGYFKNGKWHGEGSITTKTLDVYYGEFIDGYHCGI